MPAGLKLTHNRLSFYSMERDGLGLVLAVIGTACWAVCFFWMYRISRKQTSLLAEIRAQGKRIEELTKAQHDLIKDVHPQVGDIKEGVQEMIAAVKDES